MMKAQTHSSLRRDSLLTLLSLLLLHIGTCEAQSSGGSSFVAIPVSIFVVAASLMCLCFWACLGFQCYMRTRHSSGTSANARYAPYVFSQNQRAQYGAGGIAHPGSYPVQGYVPPSTTGQTSAAGYYGVSPSTVTAVGQNAPPPEPVSLPDATLHQGDAPPGYAEAIGMKTVDIAGCTDPVGFGHDTDIGCDVGGHDMDVSIGCNDTSIGDD